MAEVMVHRGTWLLFALAMLALAGGGCGDAPAGQGNALPPGDWFRAEGVPIACNLHGTVAEVEESILLPRCGAAGDGTCHATGPTPPRIAEVGKIAENLVDITPHLRCFQDKLVSSEAPERSAMLAKIRAPGGVARCNDGGDGGPGMPYQDAPQLSAAQAACLEWWVHQIAR